MKNISVSLKIAMGFIVILIVFVVVNIITLVTTSSVHKTADWVEHTHEVLTNIELLQGQLKDAETGQRGFIVTGFESYLEPYNNANTQTLNTHSRLKTLTSDNPNQQKRLNEVEPLIKAKFEELAQTIQLRREEGFDAARDVIVGDLGKQVMDDIRVILTDMTQEENDLLKKRREQSAREERRSRSITIWLTVFVAIIVILLIRFYMKVIVYPINEVSERAKRIAQGDLSEYIAPSDRGDEIGVLTESFRSLQENFQKKAMQAEKIAEGDLTIQVQASTHNDTLGNAFALMVKTLRRQMSEIYEGANVLTHSSNDIMSMISNLATGAAQTATSVSETTTTIEEIKQTAEISNQKAVEVSDSGQKIAEISQEGNRSVQQTIEGMSKIKEQMESIASIVIQLSEKSHAIGEIATTVNDLAEQSNLLAVNASIEAAKAGDHGKGFAVVAQEIKNLATRSKESTVQIRNLLADIQKEIGGAVMATEQGGKVITEGLELSSTANKVIETLSSGVEEAAQANLLIASSSQQQLIGIDQINTAMESIKDASMQNSNSTNKTKESVAELNQLGARLMKIIGQYKLESDGSQQPS